VYDIYLESAAERDLKRLSPTAFRRLIEHIRSLPRIQDRQDVIKSWGPEVIGGSGWVIIEPFTRLMKKRIQLIKVMRVRHRREAYR